MQPTAYRQDPIVKEVLVKDINGSKVITGYDKSTSKITTTFPYGGSKIQQLDSNLNIEKLSQSGLYDINYGYDDVGRLNHISFGEREQDFVYTDRDLLKEVRVNGALQSLYEYNDRAQLVGITQNDRKTTFERDFLGNVTSITNGNNDKFSFVQNSLRSMVNFFFPGSSEKIEFKYNKENELLSKTLVSGKKIEFLYEEGKTRLQSIIAPSRTLNYEYDDISGNLTRISRGDDQLKFEYDGHLLKTIVSDNLFGSTVSMEHNNSFALSGFAVNGLQMINYQFYANGSIKRAGDVYVERDSSTGFTKSLKLDNVSEELSFNLYGEIENQDVYYGDTKIYSKKYTYDNVGRSIASISSISDSQKSISYNYNSNNEIDSYLEGEVVKEEYDYDKNGNFLNYNGLIGTYNNKDWLISLGPLNFDYDLDGNTIAINNGTLEKLYTYDEFGNLLRYEDPTITLSYAIDPVNRRIGKIKNGNLVNGYIYLDKLKIAAEVSSSGQVVSRFIYGDQSNVPIYMIKGATKYRIISDRIGSPVLVVNSSNGEIVQEIEYTPFGKVIKDTNPGFIPFGFAGGLYDQDTKLLRFGARDYNPETGRWMQKDPIGFAGGDTNLYRYCGNNPVNCIDPTGNFGVYGGYKLQGVAGLGTGGGASIGARFVYGSENGKNIDTTIAQGQIPQMVVGASAGRGFEAGVFFLDISDFESAKETSIDTPIGGLTIFSNGGFFSGFGISGPSAGFSIQSTTPGGSPSLKKGGVCEQ